MVQVLIMAAFACFHSNRTEFYFDNGTEKALPCQANLLWFLPNRLTTSNLHLAWSNVRLLRQAFPSNPPNFSPCRYLYLTPAFTSTAFKQWQHIVCTANYLIYN
jgi:hypothetical protein